MNKKLKGPWMFGNSVARRLSIVLATLFMFAGATSYAQAVSAQHLLREAYINLATANHDYRGRRMNAMKEVRAAGKTIGLDVRRDAKVVERQGISDEHLRAARAMLAEARPVLDRRGVTHVDRAIKQIDIALNTPPG